MTRISAAVLAALLLGPTARAVDCLSCHAGMDEVPWKDVQRAMRSADDLQDHAIGVQDRGQLSNYSANFGDMADFHIWANEALHWPSEAGETTQYAFGLGLVVARPGNVIESCLNAVSGLKDWTPAAGSLGTLHSGEPRASDDTPYMAHSNLADSWPDGRWPGPWRQEYVAPVPIPGSPTRPVIGEFTSDSDTWCVFDDRENPRGALGIEVGQSGFSYGRPYADDHLFWRSVIHNRSAVDLDSLWIGYYVAFRPDYDYVDRIGSTSTQALGLQNGKPNDVVYVRDVNGRNDGAWAQNDTPMGIPALLITETPRNLGVTDFHHFQSDHKPVLEEQQFAVLASREGELEHPELYFHGPGRGRIDWCDPGTLQAAYGEGTRINFFVMTGPVSIAAGDSVVSACAAVLGEHLPGDADGPDLSDLEANIGDAWEMYWRTRYAGPGAPPLPDVSAAPLPGGARLWWDGAASEAAADFEGYRVYRSLDRGASWGAPITDSQGRRVAWTPLATFDRVDGVRGPDPNGATHLGNDRGLAWSFDDLGVVEGLETWYCVTAYSTGEEDAAEDIHLPSIENPLGRSLLDRHTVAVRPGAAASDRSAPEESRRLDPADGELCDAIVELSILDPWRLPAADWQLTVHGPSAGDSLPRLDLVNATSGDTAWFDLRLPEPGRAPLPETAGFRLRVEDAREGVAELGWNAGSPCTFDWWTVDRTGLVNEYPEYVLGQDDWRLRILEPGQEQEIPVYLYFYWGGVLETPYPPSLAPIVAERRPEGAADWVPATLWAEDLRLAFPALEDLSPPGWDLMPGGLAASRRRTGYESYTDALVLRATEDPDEGTEMLLKTNNFDWILDADGDTLRGVAPLPGDVFTIRTNKRLREGLVYAFRTDPPASAAAPPALAVRAVPDPYVVGGAQEQAGGHRLLFTGLPARCTLSIYTVAGDWVRSLDHDDPGSDTLEWDLRNADRQHVAYGLYLFHVRDERGREQIGRFLIIR